MTRKVMNLPRYLDAKRSIDDHAMNRRVADRFTTLLARQATHSPGPIRILEAGAGIGAMIPRLATWEAFPAQVEYHVVDQDPRTIPYAQNHLPTWLKTNGYHVTRDRDTITARTTDHHLRISFTVADALEQTGPVNAVIAAAFLDIVPIHRAIPALFDTLHPGGLLYAPVTYDGATTFVPPHPFDDTVESIYHRHMDEHRVTPGTSHAAQRTLEVIQETEHDVIAVGRSDWEVNLEPDGLTRDETIFLTSLLETIVNALNEFPSETIDPHRVETWEATRTRELAAGTFGIAARNLDLLARHHP